MAGAGFFSVVSAIIASVVENGAKTIILVQMSRFSYFTLVNWNKKSNEDVLLIR
jgi:hypothetical protein